MFYHPTWNVKIGLSKRGRFSLTLFTASSIKLSGLKKSWSFKASLGSFFLIGIFHSGTSRSSPRLEPDFAFGGMSIAAITQAIASIPTNSPFVSFFLFIFFKFYWFVDGDRIVICSFFSRRKAEKVWWSRAVWWGGVDGLSRFTRNGDQIVFLSEAERNEEYRVCYFMFFPTVLECFALQASLLLCSGRWFFLSFTSGFDSGTQLTAGGRGRNRGKLKEICIIYF